MKLRQLVLLSGCALGTSSFGQSLFFDNFDSYPEGSSKYTDKFDYEPIEWDFDGGERLPRVVGAKDGVTPYSGNRMLDFRAANRPKTRTLKLGFESRSDIEPHFQYSLRFFIPTNYQENQRIFMGFASTNGPASIASIQTESNTFTGFATENKPILIPRDTWNIAVIDVLWPKLEASFILNGQVVAKQQYGSQAFDPPYPVGPLFFGIKENEDVSTKYSLQAGAGNVRGRRARCRSAGATRPNHTNDRNGDHHSPPTPHLENGPAPIKHD